MIRDIYRRDNKIRETAKNDEETVRLRKEELTPLFEEFHSWLKEKEDIFEAIKTKHVLNFQYRSVSSQEYKARVLNPYHVLCQKGNWYVFGYDQVAGENRIYAFSRFKNPKITAEQFTIPEGFDISKEVDLSFGIWHNTGVSEDYELLFDSSLANYILEREWHKGQKTERYI